MRSGRCFTAIMIPFSPSDLREAPLIERKGKLAKLLARARDGIRYSNYLEGDGTTIFEHACKMGLEGIVSKHSDLPYVSGRAKCWIKVRNPGERGDATV
jgi:ATP-dependent DNA ligase